MKDKIVVVTGASSGIGLATARELARQGAEIAMVCRDPKRAKAAREDVVASATGPQPRVFLADLSAQHDIRHLATAIKSRYSHIDVLINNAGAVFARREFTVDGIEKTFAVNHLAPFLLTNLLLDSIGAAAAGRIITVGSESYSSALDFENLQSEKKHHFLTAYFRSKLENILFTFELSQRLASTRVTANCLSPGPTKTRIGSNMDGWAGLFPLLVRNVPFFASPEKGARTSVYLASSSEVAKTSGRFFLRCREVRTKPVTHDVDVARRLWRLSEDLCGLGTAVTGSARDSESVRHHPQGVQTLMPAPQ